MGSFQSARDCDNTHVVAGRILWSGRLNGVGEETEDGAYPQQDRESAEHLLAELDPLRSRLGRSQLVRAVSW